MKKKPDKKANQNQVNKLNKPTGSLLKKVTAGAKGVVQAMSPKSAKKPQVKAKKAAPAPAKAAPVKTAPAKASPVKGAPAKTAPVAAIAVKGPAAKKGAPAAPVAPVLTKGKAPVSGKPAKAAKSPKLSAHSENMCRENGCENQATTKGFCRLDYIKNWKKIKRKEMILKEGKLNQYIEELVGKYPDKYIEVIRQDLSTELTFNKVIHDLELDESIDDLEYDGDSIDSLIGSIRKEGEGFGEDEF